ncbi:MAG: caspase family protein [Candidatus Aminicenantes bacterium]|jgi:uncharacterized caspase-like protein
MSRKFLILFVLLIFIGGLLSSGDFSQKREVRPKESKKAEDKNQKIALVIGNASYKKSPLKNAVNDASDMADVLKKCGFEVILKTNANQLEMEKAVREFSDSLKDGGIGLFYFSGHGVQVSGINYLIPVKSNIRDEIDVKAKAVRADYILGKIDRRRDGMNIMILDACRVNPYARRFRSPSTGLAQMDAPQGSLIVYATSPGKTADDGTGRNGIFTKHLLEMIKKTPFEIMVLLRKVRKNVMDETNDKQIPWESSSLLGSFYFSYIDTQLEKIKVEISELQPQIKDQEAQRQEFEKLKSEKEEREAVHQEEEKKVQLKLKIMEEERLLKEKERQERLKQEEERLAREEALKREKRRKKLAEEKVRLEELKKKVDEEKKKITKMKQREMSLPEARKEVESLQNKIKKMISQISKEKKRALKKLELDYQTLRDKLNQPIPPKGQFEKTSEYQDRVKKHNEDISALEKQYKTDYAEVEKRFDNEIAISTKNYIDRIDVIKSRDYPVEGLNVELIKYNADKEIFSVRFKAPDGTIWIRSFSMELYKARGLYKRRDLLKGEGYYKRWGDTRSLGKAAIVDPKLGKIPINPIFIRSTYKILNEDEFKSMVNKYRFFDNYLNKSGNFFNQYELKVIYSDKVVIDHETGLMWHQSGSWDKIRYKEAKEWINKLNQKGYAGYTDWRLPTLEEAASLLESNKMNGKLYVDPIFSEKQQMMWTGDLYYRNGYVWGIDFSNGEIWYFGHHSFVRPVRSME